MLKTCHWEITNVCNLSCRHCIADSGLKRFRELTTSQAKISVDVLGRLGYKSIKFTGGEPLMRKDFLKIAGYCREKGILLELLTNATLINPEIARQLKALAERVGVSLDGSGPNINDKIRGEGSFNKILKGIKNLQKERIPLTLFVTLTRVNTRDLLSLLRLARKLEIPEIRINDLSLLGRALINKNLLLIKTKEKRKSLINILTKFYDCAKKDLMVDDVCEANMVDIFLSSEGSLYPCVEISQRTPENFLGNILEYSPRQLAKDKRLVSKKIKDKKCCYQIISGTGFQVCINKQSECVLCS